jgi:hypothetical protein
MPVDTNALTVERVIEETLGDARAYYHGEALRALLTLNRGDMDKLLLAGNCIRKLIELEQQQQGRPSVVSPIKQPST